MWWQINQALQIAKEEHSGFAVLSTILSYFESIAKHEAGYACKGESETYFKEGFKKVFPELDSFPSDAVGNLLDALYDWIRCGLYHTSFTQGRVMLTGDIKQPVWADVDQKTKMIIGLKVRPDLVVQRVLSHFQGYIARLKNPQNIELRLNFEKRFDWS
jgi:hypothetical protein